MPFPRKPNYIIEPHHLISYTNNNINPLLSNLNSISIYSSSLFTSPIPPIKNWGNKTSTSTSLIGPTLLSNLCQSNNNNKSEAFLNINDLSFHDDINVHKNSSSDDYFCFSEKLPISVLPTEFESNRTIINRTNPYLPSNKLASSNFIHERLKEAHEDGQALINQVIKYLVDQIKLSNNNGTNVETSFNNESKSDIHYRNLPVADTALSTTLSTSINPVPNKPINACTFQSGTNNTIPIITSTTLPSNTMNHKEINIYGKRLRSQLSSQEPTPPLYTTTPISTATTTTTTTTNSYSSNSHAYPMIIPPTINFTKSRIFRSTTIPSTTTTNNNTHHNLRRSKDSTIEDNTNSHDYDLLYNTTTTTTTSSMNGGNLTFQQGKPLPPHISKVLVAWFLAHSHSPYPTNEEKNELMAQTGLNSTQLRNWFTNQRKRHWRPIARQGRIPRNQMEALLSSTNSGNNNNNKLTNITSSRR